MHAGTVAFDSIETRLGRLWAAMGEEGVLFLSLDGSERGRAALAEHVGRNHAGRELVRDERALAALRAELQEYARGERRRFDAVARPAGSEFDRRVWSALVQIPWGETRSYGELARKLGSPGAARAVGGANGRNPVPILIPCHRCLAADALGGFSGGLETKRRLLALEGSLRLGPELPFEAPAARADA